MLASYHPTAVSAVDARDPERTALKSDRYQLPLRQIVPVIGRAHESALSKNLRSNGLKMVETLRDGNCLFHSMARWMDGVDHEIVRNIVVEYVAEHPYIFETDILASGYSSTDEYCERMSQLGEWGDAITLQALIMLTGINIRLFTEYGYTDLNPNGTQHLAIVQHHGHYQPAIPLWANEFN